MKPISRVRAKQSRGEALSPEDQAVAREYERGYRQGRRIGLLPTLEEKEAWAGMAAERGMGLAPWILSHVRRSVDSAPIDPLEHKATQQRLESLEQENRALRSRLGDDQAELSQLRFKVEEYANTFMELAVLLEES